MQSKSNQFSISIPKLLKTKTITAIEINLINKTIIEIQIQNSIEVIQKKLDFYNFEKMNFENSRDYILIGNDNDCIKKSFFTIKNIENKFYQNAIILNISSKEKFDNFQSSKQNIEEIRKIITFCE